MLRPRSRVRHIVTVSPCFTIKPFYQIVSWFGLLLNWRGGSSWSYPSHFKPSRSNNRKAVNFRAKTAKRRCESTILTYNNGSYTPGSQTMVPLQERKYNQLRKLEAKFNVHTFLGSQFFPVSRRRCNVAQENERPAAQSFEDDGEDVHWLVVSRPNRS